MSEKDPSTNPEQNAAAGAAPEKDPATVVDTEQLEDELISDDDLLSEIEEPSKKDTDTEKAERDRQARMAQLELKLVPASKRVQKRLDDGEELEDAIAEEATNLQGSLRKMFNGEDLYPEDQKDPEEIASKAVAAAREKEAFEKTFLEIVKENGLDSKTTTSVEKRKQLLATVNELAKNPSKTKLLKAVAAQMFGAEKNKKSGAVAARVEAKKIQKPKDNPFESFEKTL